MHPISLRDSLCACVHVCAGLSGDCSPVNQLHGFFCVYFWGVPRKGPKHKSFGKVETYNAFSMLEDGATHKDWLIEGPKSVWKTVWAPIQGFLSRFSRFGVVPVPSLNSARWKSLCHMETPVQWALDAAGKGSLCQMYETGELKPFCARIVLANVALHKFKWWMSKYLHCVRV